MRATTEIVDITSSDAVDTAIKIDVDLDQITHEAFHVGSERMWLPLAVLPVPQDDERAEGPTRAERVRGRPAAGGLPPPAVPDPFTTLTVTDATGGLVAMVPDVEVRHWIAAAMAEIIESMAVANWDGPSGAAAPRAARAQRLLLSAAIYRMLHHGPAGSPAATATGAEGRPGPGSPRPAENPRGTAVGIGAAKDVLVGLLTRFGVEIPPSGQQPGSAGQAGRLPGQAITGRAAGVIGVIKAFAQSTVVVVAAARDRSPTVLLVRVPARRLARVPRTTLTGPLARIGTPAFPWSPARLHIDVLMPSADADRQVQVNLPDGVHFDSPRAAGSRAEMVIEVDQPPSVARATAVKEQAEPRLGPTAHVARACFDDLATVKQEAAAETLGHYLDSAPASVGQFGPDGGGGPGFLWRHTSPDTFSPRAAVARAVMIEDVSQRGAPRRAWIDVDVSVADAEFFSTARVAGTMSAAVMTVVLIFFIVFHGHRTGAPSTSVLAGALTLFTAVQAARIEYPDQSTLRGLLSAWGWLVIAVSIFPTVILAVWLAFDVNGTVPVTGAAVTIAVEIMLQAVLQSVERRSRESRRPPRRLLRTSPTPDYTSYSRLQSDWWRGTTADALKIGRSAHAYVIWEHDSPPSLSRLLDGTRQSSPPDSQEPANDGAAAPMERPANVLALVRIGTENQALTFVVFREKPADSWIIQRAAQNVELDPDRLAPLENPTDIVELFVSTPRDREPPALDRHPLARVLSAAAENQLIVLDVQTPVASPAARFPKDTLNWARVRIGLRDDQLHRLPDFLNAAYQKVTGRDPASGAYCPPSNVLVRVAPGCELRPIVKASRVNPAAGPRVIVASELDVISPAARWQAAPPPGADGRPWRVLALCANARVDIPDKILGRLGRAPGSAPGQRQRLGLGGLTYAMVHGTAVMLVIGYQPDRRSDPDPEFTFLCESNQDVGLAVPVNEWQTTAEMGSAKNDPLLRLRIQAEDRPGTLLDVLRSVNDALRDGGMQSDDQSSAWHVITRVTVGHETRLTARVGIQQDDVEAWRPKFAKMERAIQEYATNRTAERGSERLFDDPYGAPVDTVISVNFVEAPERPTRAGDPFSEPDP